MTISSEAQSFTHRAMNNNGRKSYARIQDILPLPDLIKTQIESFNWFKTEGIREVFDEISPIESFNEKLAMYFPGYDEALNEEFGLDFRFESPPYTQDECRARETTYAAPLYVKVLLHNRELDQPIVQDVYMGDFPMMTPTGSFIINGNERVVVSQLIRSPGAYFEVDEDRRTGRQLCTAKLIPDRGAWLEFDTSRRDIISVRVDRKRKIPVTLLLRALGAVSDGMDEAGIGDGTDEEIYALLEDVDNDPDLSYIRNAMEKDGVSNAEEALSEFYHRMRPGDPATLDNARSYLESLLFNPRRYDLGKVGRYKLSRRLGTDLPDSHRTLTKRDIIEIVRRMIQVNLGMEEPDDIDHLGNRRIKTVGELVQNQLRIGFMRAERAIKGRMNSRDIKQATPMSLINVRPVTSVLHKFFSSSQLSQFMGQVNPLDELTHKRTLSALGPGGLKAQYAGFDVRDVHHTHYGRICPIETPEGPNIGLIGRLATYADVNDYGFIETPYRRVRRSVVNEADELMGRELRQDVVDPETEETIAQAGTVVDEELAPRIAELPIERVSVRAYVTEEVQYLSADEEERYVVAQANSPLDDNGEFVTDRVSARVYEQFVTESIDRVSYMDVSPKQIVGVSAALIPFLEHDDANRALMGSNMQRQGVPLVQPEAPVVGTGMEYAAALDSGQTVVSDTDGEVISVTGHRIVVRDDDGDERGYELRRFARSNQSTCIDQRPIVAKGQHVRKGQVIADTSSTENGELALGQNTLCAFMSWEGGNFEDAIVISEGMVRQDMYTSIHLEKYEIEARDTKRGTEEITRDIPNVGDDALRDLDEEGIIYIGAEVGPGDILVGKITPKGETELTPEEKLLRAIFGEKARDVRDSSLRMPHGEEGIVVDTKVFTREENRDMQAGVEKMVRVTVARRLKLTEGDKMSGRHGNKGVISRVVPIEDMPYLEDGTPIEIILNPLGVPGRMNVGQVLETHLGWAASRLGFRVMTPISDGASEDEISAELARAWLSDRAWSDLGERIWPWVEGQEILQETLQDDREARQLFLAEYLLGRDWSVDQVEEVLADRTASRRVWLRYWLEEKGFDAQEFMFYQDASLDLPKREAADELARQVCLRLWLADHEVDAEGLSAEEIDRRAISVSQETEDPLPTTGKMILYDGKTGKPFDQPVTVGVNYMLKLIHLVKDKVHARSTGPYSLVTQQPLGGKAQFGGQRFGEMEVWALEAYGAAYTLQEMLTIKSDDVSGRFNTYESIIKGEPVNEFGMPASFRVLVKELQSLGIDVAVRNEEGDYAHFGRQEQRREVPEMGFGLGYGSLR